MKRKIVENTLKNANHIKIYLHVLTIYYQVFIDISFYNKMTFF